MFIIKLENRPEFTAGDNSRLREILHPDKILQQDSTVPTNTKPKLRYSLAHATVPPRSATVPHRLRSSEVYYILQGQGCMHIDDQAWDVGPSDAVYIPPLSVQHISNVGNTDLIFLCIVDPAWQQEGEEIFGA
jgi:mannose-6-phosphate isomerase-like protein (cupin superfamily)